MKRKMNVKLLRKIQRHILEEPKRLDMDKFICRKGDPNTWRAPKYPACGTVGCIAGWAVTLSTEDRVPYSQIQARGQKLLGLSNYQANQLFFSANWPSHFQDAINSTNAQTKAHANIVAEVIDTFIENHGDLE